MSENLEKNEIENDENEDLFDLTDNDILDADLMDNDIEVDDIEIDDDDDDGEDDEEKDDVDNSISSDESESELDIYFKYGTNNHKLDGKHSLKRDTIWHGKLAEEVTEEMKSINFGMMEYEFFDKGDMPIERGSVFEEESRNAEEVQSKRKLSQDVYHLLKENTELDFRSNRRKPNKATFNNYYRMLLVNIDKQYTRSEIFVELAYYFTDNIFNMYKLLDKKYATTIIKELRGKGFLIKELEDIDFK